MEALRDGNVSTRNVEKANSLTSGLHQGNECLPQQHICTCLLNVLPPQKQRREGKACELWEKYENKDVERAMQVLVSQISLGERQKRKKRRNSVLAGY